MPVISFIKKTFSFDDRSMALYRVLIGIIVMSDVIYRWPDLMNFYTDVGLIPRSIFTSELTMPWSLSFHLANGSYLFAVLMFSLHFLFGLMLFVGFKSRGAMIGAFLMTVSVHNRNWLVNNGGDDVLRAILFLSIFLPLNRCFSLDSALNKEKKETTDYFSTWTLAFFLQAFVIYFVSYILKNHPIWREELTAVHFSSRLDIFASGIGIWIRDYPFIMKFITGFSIYLEWLGPILLMLGFIFGKRWWIVRMVIVVLFMGFHFGIFATMNIGLFPFIAITMWSIFIPGPVWDKFMGYFEGKNYGKITIYFDGECGFCQKGVRIIREFFLLPEVGIKVAQETPAVYADMQKNHSWVVVNERSERFFHFSAWIELVRHSPLLRPLAAFFALRPINWMGQKIYLWVSGHRGLMGKLSQFLEYSTAKKEIVTFKWLLEALGAFIFVTLFMWNLTTIKKYNIKAPFFQTVTRWLHLYQEWNMFAPYPKMDNIWIEVPATLSDDSEIELLTGDRDIYGIKDQAFYAQIPNEHWRKFYLNLSEKSEYARYYGGYLCRQWNKRNIRLVKDTTLRKMEIIVYSQPNLPNGDKGGISRKLSWKHWCFDEDYKREAKSP
ncbi:MAG: DCC1-like thiol-disulfide oxidoreductase family protein [Bacteriovoracaceae bacterium]|nr:DCC1-like thiol-disulfide oxidoreductase family protein [Bacteriovoracaceae bacterium]